MEARGRPQGFSLKKCTISLCSMARASWTLKTTTLRLPNKEKQAEWLSHFRGNKSLHSMMPVTKVMIGFEADISRVSMFSTSCMSSWVNRQGKHGSLSLHGLAST